MTARCTSSLCLLLVHVVVSLLVVTSLGTSEWMEGEVNEEGELSMEYVLGSNAKHVTVCASLQCVDQTLRLPQHSDKLMLFLPTINVDGDSYVSYYLGLVFDYFIFEQDDGDDDGGGVTVRSHLLIWSLTHAMPDGPYGMEEFAEYASSDKGSRTMLEIHANYVKFINDGGLYHKYLALVVLNDAQVMTSYWEIALAYKGMHNTSLFALIHLNHEQPWLDNQEASTITIRESYSATEIVFRTHFYTEFMKVTNVHYIPLGSGQLQTERISLALKQENRRFPLAVNVEILNISQRPLLCSFAGSMRYKYRGNTVESSRSDMINTLEGIPGCVFYPTDDSSETASLSQSEYLEMAFSSMFSLCPRGVGPETNRPYQVSSFSLDV